jgi:hypothetical protein
MAKLSARTGTRNRAGEKDNDFSAASDEFPKWA